MDDTSTFPDERLELIFTWFRDERPLAANAVDGAVAGGHDQPASRVLGWPSRGQR